MPKDGAEIFTNRVSVIGIADPKAKVWVNGSRARISRRSGRYKKRIKLRRDKTKVKTKNLIKIVAKKKGELATEKAISVIRAVHLSEILRGYRIKVDRISGIKTAKPKSIWHDCYPYLLKSLKPGAKTVTVLKCEAYTSLVWARQLIFDIDGEIVRLPKLPIKSKLIRREPSGGMIREE